MQAEKDRKFYLDELKSDECFCGKTKKPGFSFCYKCYKSLLHDMKKDLYQRIGDGYEEAHDAAITFLI